MRLVLASVFIWMFSVGGALAQAQAHAEDKGSVNDPETREAEIVRQQTGPSVQGAEGGSDEEALIEEIEAARPVGTETKIHASPGYRFLHETSDGSRAAEYAFLRSGFAGSALFSSIGPELKIDLDGSYLNENDYVGDLLFDYRGRLRMQLRTEALFHNLDHLPLFANSFNLWGMSYTPNDHDPGGRYGLRVEQDTARLRFMPWEYPFHLNLGFWRMTKDGSRQLIYADQVFSDSSGNGSTIHSIARDVRRETIDGLLGFDVHLGYIDLCYNFNIREFANHADNPRDQFVARSGSVTRPAGLQEHNVEPDSRLLSHTVKLHTSLTGGLAGALSYTHSTRRNVNEPRDITLSAAPENRLQNIVAEFVYTPRVWFSVAGRYRHQEIDADHATIVSSLFPSTPEIVVKPPIGTQRDVAALTVSVRPNNLLTLKGEYKGEFVRRDNAEQWPDLPKHTDIHRVTATILGRLKNGLRCKAQYEYATVDQPAYGNFFSDRHDGQLLITYASRNRWGMSANYRITNEGNDEFSLASVSTTPTLFRERKTNNATASAWVNPTDKLTLNATYGFLRTRADQDVVFNSYVPARTAANFRSQAQLYSMGLSYRCTDRLDLALLFQQVHSFALFDPAGTTNIREQSESRTVETSASARAGYSFTRDFACSLEYGYKRYNEKNSQLFDGTVQTITMLLTRKW